MKNEKQIGHPLNNLPNDYTIVDLETSGLIPKFHHIVEVGCIKYRAGKEVARFETLIKPPIKIAEKATSINGITNEMLMYAPTFETVADDLWEFLKDEVIVGHNITFDIAFLHKNFLNALNQPFANDYVDTLELSRRHFPHLKSYSLENLCKQFQIATQSHRAVSDCLAVADIIKLMNTTTAAKESAPMAIKLHRGQKVDLTKNNPALKRLLIGMGWKKDKDFELDSAAFLLDSTGNATCEDDFIFYNNVRHKSGAIEHIGNQNVEDNEQMRIDLWKVPPSIHKIDFTLTIYDAEQRNQTFSQLDAAYIRIVDIDTGNEIARYDLTQDFSIETAIVVGEIYRHGSDWKFHALGSGFGGGLAALVRNFGLKIGNPVVKNEQLSASVHPSIKSDVKKLAALRQCTMSEIVSEALQIYLDARRSDIQRYDQLIKNVKT